MIFAGVDPGLSGAIVVLDCLDNGAGRPRIVAMWDMPISESTKRPNHLRKRLVLDKLYAIVRGVEVFEPRKFLVEDVQGMGHQRGSSTFGYNVGVLHMAATAAKLPLEIVAPSRWKPDLRCPALKRAATKLAASLIEDGERQFYGPKGGMLDGRAEAALIAYWGWTKAQRIGRKA